MKKHKDLIDTTIWNIADVSSNRCMSAKEIRASIRPKIENLVGQILKANPVENRVMPKIAGELLKYLDGVIETRKNGYTNNYREMLMKEAHLEAFENVKGWLINKLNESNFTA